MTDKYCSSETIDRSITLPFLSVIIPVTGFSPLLEKNLLSFIGQNYHPYEILFVLQDPDDPAFPLIHRIARNRGDIKIIFAGKAHRCSQKNYNLLAGIDHAGERPDILVFCDSGHHAHPDWLKCLITPLLTQPDNSVSSGFYCIVCREHSIVTWGRALCVFAIQLARSVPRLGLPWGGATAIRKEVFDRLAVVDIWKTNIIDDLSLASLLEKNEIPVFIPSHVNVTTRLNDISLHSWNKWLVRQIAYLKYIYPALWTFIGVGLILLTAVIHTSLLVVLTALFLPISTTQFCFNLIILLLFACFSCLLCRQHTRPAPLRYWIPSAWAALTLAAWAHMQTWFSKTIEWANISYTVGQGGRVKKIVRLNSNKEKNR